MDSPRIACVDIPALPLQLLVRARPDWREHAVAVVQTERALADVLWLNQKALCAGVRRGMQLGQAQAVCCSLRAAAVPEEQVEASVQELLEVLISFSPAVEPCFERPGVFWLDPGGIQGLFGSHSSWAEAMRQALGDRGYSATVVVGFSRYLVFAIAQTASGALVLSDPGEEKRLAYRVRLDRLDLPPRLFQELGLLGIDTLGRFLKLSAGELRARYGKEAAEFHQLASGSRPPPLQPYQPSALLRAEVEIDPPDDSHTRLLFALKGLLDRLIDQSAARREAIAALQILLRLDGAPPYPERIEAAAPTLDAALMLELIRLRLGAIQPAAPVEHVELQLETVTAHPRQLELLPSAQRRDLLAAARALARLKAAFGAAAVTRARLRPAYLPEASFYWEPVSEVQEPRPTESPGEPLLVRRVFANKDSFLPSCMEKSDVFGPYRIAGGWWRRRVERDYYFVETGRRHILWLFHDRPRQRWVLHGIVE